MKKIQAIDKLQWNLLTRNPSPKKTYNQDMANDLYAEASQNFDSGEYLNAVALFILFKEHERILACLHSIDDDMLALYAACRVEDFTLWTRYRTRKKHITLDPLKAAHYQSQFYPTVRQREKNTPEVLHGLMLILEDILDAADSSVITRLKITMYLPLEICADFCSDSVEHLLNAGRDYLRLIAKIRDYTKISTEGLRWLSTMGSNTAVLSVIDYLDNLAQSLNDPLLSVCASTIRGTPVDMEIIKNQTIDESNWRLLSVFSEIKDKVVNYLIEHYFIQEAADTLRIHGAHRQAAELLESYHFPKDAAKIYEYLQEWDKAFEIYTRLGDQHRIARMYERKGDYPAAIKLWKQLGYPKQVERLQKKRRTTINDTPQPELGLTDEPP